MVDGDGSSMGDAFGSWQQDPPLLLVLSAPSGAGKSTICERLLKRNPTIHFSVSTTTRPPRSHEQDGVDYHFVDEEQFQTMRSEGRFIEWARVHGEYYGTSRRAVESSLGEGRDVLLDIDVQGARQVLEAAPGAVTIFIVPPSLEELERRLRERGTETESQIEERLATARRELESLDHYEYVVVNDVVSDAVGDLERIRCAEKCRVQRIRGTRGTFAPDDSPTRSDP